MPRVPKAVYFTDENALGLGKLLRRSGRDDVLYPGHAELPEVPIRLRPTPRTAAAPSTVRSIHSIGG